MYDLFNKLIIILIKVRSDNNLKPLLIIAFLLPFYFILYKINIPQTNSFGCFDECLNIGGAYFMLQGKQLYSQVFFNHQPFMAYISYLIQSVTNPINLYELLLRHMQFTLLFSFIANFFIIKRFRLAGLGFVVVYELSKFYIFGTRFLGESYVVYMMVYMGGLLWNKYSKNKIYPFEYIIVSLATWFTIFTREPFTIAVLFAYILLIWKPQTIYKKFSLAVLIAFSLITIILQPIEEYIYSITTVSSQGVLVNELHNNLNGSGLLKIFIYPVFVIIEALGAKINEFWMLLLGISITFIILSVYMLVIRKKYRLLLVVYLLLGFSNIRYLNFGDTYYGAFHIIPWFGMVLLFMFLIIFDNFKKYKIFTMSSLFIIIGFFMIYIFQPNLFFKQHTDLPRDLLINYGKTINIGEIVNTISNPKNTFFIEKNGLDDSLALAYWQAKRNSSYKYSWYIYFAPSHKRYTDARVEMLNKYPPDFYYAERMDPFLKKRYKSLTVNNKPSKIYVRKEVYNQISEEKWKAAEQFSITK